MASFACDLAIIGGGLSGGLIALAAQRARPSARILLIEARPQLGGNHIWSFLDSDIEPADKALLEPFITYGWREFAVVFPTYKRVRCRMRSTVSARIVSIRRCASTCRPKPSYRAAR